MFHDYLIYGLLFQLIDALKTFLCMANALAPCNNFFQLIPVAWYIGPGTTGSECSGTNNGTGSDQGEKTHHGSATLPATLHSATSQNSMGRQAPPKFPSDEGSECSSVTSESIERWVSKKKIIHIQNIVKTFS